MLKGYRGIIAAFGLATIVLLSLSVGAFFGALSAPNYGYQTKEATDNTASEHANPSQIDRDRAGLPYFVERIASASDPENADEREKRNLAAQEAAALWGFWILVVSSIGTVTTMVGTGFLLWQIVLTRHAVEDTGKATIAMQEANEIARDGMEKQLRAYVHPESFSYISQPDETNQNFGWGFAISWKNLGVTPALSASMLIWTEVVDGALAKDFKFDRIAEDHVPVVFGPNMPVTSSYALVGAEDVRKVFAGQKALYLWGWVTYKDVFPASPERQTRFCYRMSVTGDPTKAVGPDNIVHWTTTIHVAHNSAD